MNFSHNRIRGRRFTTGFGLMCAMLAVFSGCRNRGNVRVGGACTIDQSCGTAVCIRESKSSEGRAWIGGYCSGNCSVDDCPQGRCLELTDGYSYCVSECESTSECRQGYVCSPDAKACLPDCSLGWSCGSSLTCDTESGACVAPKVTPMPLGSPCSLNAGCQGGLCIPETSSSSGISWTDGTCTQDCSSVCPSGSTCLTFQDGKARCLTACSASKTCRQGYVCSPDAKVCLPDCRLGWSCGSSLTCDSETGACAAPKSTPQSTGSPCTLNAGCQGGLCIPENVSSSGTSWTSGTCTQDCASSSCPSGSTCLTLQDGNSRCLTACSASNTCRQGYVCSPDAKVCLPDCRLGWSCGSSLTCDSATGVCTAPNPTPQPLGSPCTLNVGCQGGLCIPEISSSSGTSWTAGTCTQDCALSGCPAGSTCLTFQDDNSRCLTACSATSNCRQGYVCSPDAKVCLPDCRLGWSCGSSLTCDTATGACAAPKPTPQPLGSPCTLNAGCEGGLCIPQSSSSSGTVWTAGTCTQDCAASACPSGSTCFAFLDGTSRCLTACSGPTCRQGYVCSSDAKVCLPDCRLGWGCGNLICDKATGECEPTVVTDAGVKVDTRPANTDAGRDTASTVSGNDAFTPGPGGAGGGGGGMGPGPGGPGGRT